MKRFFAVYALTAVPPYLIFCMEEGVKLGFSDKKLTAKSMCKSFCFATFKGIFYPYYFYKYTKGDIYLFE
ncbi:hypothetical protein ISTM_311 [Insectomime virus]|uniref:Uncharacterized protein n=1 Tax=Tunisvirus fontaine2 TaxID=1421067 RepID=V9SEI9_9VIRU|nr:hypothetical protein D1R32_gp004 [Tunisvirus fontaine2]AHA46209.1 hypothetical protein ISTM_311 [Insectomime virus]AHC54721.1 hypothetical protein TNS_ORF3 [Tunisvirus fontaine2]